MTDVVLVHGAWHGGWCWDAVRPLLEQGGYEAHAPTLAGLGERAAELTPAIGLADHVRDLADVLEGLAEPACLVGHSYAGLVVRDAAALAPEKVHEIVLVESWIGAAGASLLELAPDWFAQGMRQAATADGDGWAIPPPDPAVVGVTEAPDAERLRELLTPHPLKTFTDRTTTRSDSPAPMRAIVGSAGPIDFGAMATALRLPLRHIEGGHDLMITSPRALADALMEHA